MTIIRYRFEYGTAQRRLKTIPRLRGEGKPRIDDRDDVVRVGRVATYVVVSTLIRFFR